MAQTSGSSSGSDLWQSLLKWPTWFGWLVVFAAFLLGIGTDAIGSASHTVNILAPPLLLLMLWNVAVYGLIAVNALSQSRHFKLPKLNQTEVGALARGTTIMHWAAAALALGALLAMYWRGLVFDYQALWQSTFLSAKSAHQLVGAVLTPAVWLGSLCGGSVFPDLTTFEQLRSPASQGENAGRWIHWYAISVFLVVLLPRTLLALWSYRQAQKLEGQQAVAAKKPHIFSKTQASLSVDAQFASKIDPTTYASIQTIALSLVAHTNVGKTTLARTLLGRDIGEVRNAEHVTHTAERHVLVEAVNQSVLERLELWDTPGFGDSELMAKRMAQAGNPIGWFLAEVWDRFQNRAFWYSQRAVRHILDESDVVLYLINASENPTDVAYLDAELKVLDLIGKPVVVLLNQVADHNGVPATPELAQAQLQRWKARLSQQVSKATCVKDILLLDAFTRCWVQEGRLLEAVALSLPQRQDQFARLNATWKQRNLQRFELSMKVLAQRLSRAAQDCEIVKETSLIGKLTSANAEKDAAMQRLAKRLDADVRSSTDALIQLHQLNGSASNTVLTRLSEHVALKAPKSEGKSALWGGVVTGALMGLKADILSGGMTLGGGMLAGGVLGALGGAGLARGYNQVKGIETPTIAWTPEVLDDLTRSALLGYLAVAHFGRGRGEWTHAEPPAFWVERIEASLAPQWGKLHALWEKSPKSMTTEVQPNGQNNLQTELQTILQQTSQAVLKSLYPDAVDSK
jgi:GTP-binding protein EngB required for normal cell division